MCTNAPIPNYLTIQRETVSHLRQGHISDNEVATIQRLAQVLPILSIDEITNIYLPLSHLLEFQFRRHNRYSQLMYKLIRQGNKKSCPFIIGVAGSVSSGKSTMSNTFLELIKHWQRPAQVTLISTDNFLLSNQQLQERNILNRKGFPESYNNDLLLKSLSAIKNRQLPIKIPVYSHSVYDIVANQYTEITHDTDVVIVEGINTLQDICSPNSSSAVTINDFLDYKIYVDAQEETLLAWYLDRFMNLWQAAHHDEHNYYRKFIHMSEAEVRELAINTWNSINLVNLHQYIKPTKNKANLILLKDKDHRIIEFKIRK